MQRKEGHKHRRNSTNGEKRLDPNRQEISFDLFASYMNLWFEYVNACSSMYAEYIRSTRKMTEYWLNLFSKFWSGRQLLSMCP
jgi:hypothetical protein